MHNSLKVWVSAVAKTRPFTVISRWYNFWGLRRVTFSQQPAHRFADIYWAYWIRLWSPQHL